MGGNVFRDLDTHWDHEPGREPSPRPSPTSASLRREREEEMVGSWVAKFSNIGTRIAAMNQRPRFAIRHFPFAVSWVDGLGADMRGG